MTSQFEGIGVVIDTGSQCTKAGFAHEASPRCVIPSATARFRHAGLIDGLPQIFCGHEAIRRRGISNLIWPVVDGHIQNWEEMEKFWHHIFYKELHVPPEEIRLMHAVHSLVPRNEKEKIAEIMFETFTTQALYLIKAPVAALHASGRTSGVVWDGGFSNSNITAVFEGFPLKHATKCSPVTGDILTDRFQKLMTLSGYPFTTPVERTILERIKADMCYIAQDYAAEEELFAKSKDKQQYELPDGQKVLLGEERFRCPECIFKPSLENLNCPGLVELICQCISNCDVDYKSLFSSNIVLSGGSGQFPGLATRLINDLRRKLITGDDGSVQVDAMPSRQFAVWVGASLLASLDDLKGFWVSKKDYEDHGPECVNYKFF